MATTPATNRMLIVEDDASVRRLMMAHFRNNGFEVDYAMSAEEVASDERYDVVLTDVHLPGESGVDLANRIHRMQPNQQVVFVTGDADANVARAAVAAGAAGYLLKPFELFELDAMVHAAIRQTPPLHFRPHLHVTSQPLVVLAPARRRLSGLRRRLRMLGAVAAMAMLAWGAGAAITPKTEAAESDSFNARGSSQPVVVPIVMEKSVYLR